MIAFDLSCEIAVACAAMLDFGSKLPIFEYVQTVKYRICISKDEARSRRRTGKHAHRINKMLPIISSDETV